MRRGGREFLRLSSSLCSPFKLNPFTKLPSPTCAFQRFGPVSTSFFSSSTSTTPIPTSEEEKTSSKSQRDLLLLEKFRLRKLKASSKTLQGSPQASSSTVEKINEKGLKNEGETTEVVTSFKELGLGEELIEVLEKIGVFVPSEIQCVGIPAVLEGKSVLLSSVSGPDRTLAYLLPLIQLLRQDAKLSGSNSQHPRAIVLCATEDKAEQCFNAAKYIIHHAESKSAKDGASQDNEQSKVSIGLVIGCPSEILQYIEDGSVIPAEIRYLVLDEADFMLDNGLNLEIHKIVRPLQDYASKSTTKGLQTVLVTSTITEILGEQSPNIKHLGHDHAGQISALLLEMDPTEVYHLTESLDALRKKMTEAMDSLL